MPINNQQRQPLLQPDQNTDPEMQRQPDNQANANQPIQQRHEPNDPEASNAAERWAAPLPPPEISVDSPISETSNVAERWAVPLPVDSPVSETNTHPALRRQQDSSNYA